MVHDAADRARRGHDYRCGECGYGVTVYRELLRCPMCGATAWEPAHQRRIWQHRVGPER